jgi:hypothetical protein
VGQNPELADDLATGELGSSQVDAIADAAIKTGGGAACDLGLISSIKNAAPDEAHNIAKAWVDEHNHPDPDLLTWRLQTPERFRSEAEKRR